MKPSYKLLSLLLISFTLFSFTKPSFQTNFSGTWTLNSGKSELGEFGNRIAPSKIIVDQKADGVTVTKTSMGRDGSPVEIKETLAEGKESETMVSGSKKKSVLKWAADGNSYTINSTINFEGGGQSFEVKGAEAWSLSADGKFLTLNSTLSTPQGDITLKAVYDKQ